jgi:hypothetical protein
MRHARQMEKETHAPSKKETTEKTGTIQINLFLNMLSALFFSFF